MITPMLVIHVLVTLLLLGFVLWAIKSAGFIDGNIKTVMTWIVVGVAILFVLSAFGLLPSFVPVRVR